MIQIAEKQVVEDLIYKLLKENTKAAGALCRHNDQPAVFYQSCPHDKDTGWRGLAQYPRITYNVDWSADTQRKTAGSLVVEIWCTNETAQPEDIGPEVIKELSEVFLTDETGTYCMVWKRSDVFEATGGEAQVLGLAVSFDVLAFPDQRTSADTGPVSGLCEWIKGRKNAAKLINVDEIQDVYRPTDVSPAVYVRVVSQRNAGRDSYAVAWIDATLAIHVICPSIKVRQQWCMDIMSELTSCGEFLLKDKSPFMIQACGEINLSMRADPLSTGQITVKGRYGVLHKEDSYERLNHAYMR